MNDVEVNGKLLSFEAFTELNKSKVLKFDAMGCTSLVSLDLPVATTVIFSGCLSLVSLNAPAATTVIARDCTSLVSLALPAATTVIAINCKSLVSLELPATTTVNARGCASLISLNLPQAIEVDVTGCTGLSTDVLTYLKAQCGENLMLDAPDDIAASYGERGQHEQR